MSDRKRKYPGKEEKKYYGKKPPPTPPPQPELDPIYKIRLSNAIPQDYDLPDPILSYIITTADIKISMKLSKSCKFLKKLQKRSKCFLQSFDCSTDQNKSWIFKLLDQEKLKFEAIKIQKSFRLVIVNRRFLTRLLENVNLRETKESIEVCTHDNLDYEMFYQLMQPKVNSFKFTFSTTDVCNPVLLAFKRLESATVIKLNWVNFSDALITRAVFGSLFKIQRKVKLLECSLATLIGIAAEDVIRFCDMFMDNLNGTLTLRFSRYDNDFRIFEHRLNEMIEDRIVQSRPLCQIILEQGYSKITF